MNDRIFMLQLGLEAAFRRKLLLLTIFTVILGSTALYTAFAPRYYESAMQIVVQDSREKPLEGAGHDDRDEQPELE